jgi:hypothetical protein
MRVPVMCPWCRNTIELELVIVEGAAPHGYLVQHDAESPLVVMDLHQARDLWYLELRAECPGSGRPASARYR